jgi:glucose/arabinose dehydrogenase
LIYICGMIAPSRNKWRLMLLAGLVLLTSCAPRPVARSFVTGLNQPRGMAFDEAGNLFVAEAGDREAGRIEGPDPGVKPADTNHSGRVLRITPDRNLSTVVEGLPYTYYWVSGDVGASDVVILDDELYVLIGEGYDDELSRTVLRATPAPRGRPRLQVVASILNFAIGMSTVVEQEMGTVTSNPYAMVAAEDGSALYVSDGASGRVLRITLDGEIRVFAEFPDMPPLAGLAFGPDGRLYIAMFSMRPHTAGSGEIWAADPAGQLTSVVHDLTMPIDVGFDAAGAMYVLEFGESRPPDQLYAPDSGRLLRIRESDEPAVVLDRLNYPTAMAFSPAGDLYIAVGGAFTPAGDGAIVRVHGNALDRISASPSSSRTILWP